MHVSLRWLWSYAMTLAMVVILGASSAGGAGPLRVGLVLDNGDVSNPFYRGAYLGLQRAVRQLGVAGKVAVVAPTGTPLSVFSYFARQRYDLIIALGFVDVSNLDAAAERFPASRFLLLDASWHDLLHRPKNVLGTEFKTEQASYLAGYLAALMEKRRGHVVGSVGGAKIPPVDAYIAGYQAGARKADPGMTVLNGYANDFANPAKCRAIAQQEIAAGAGAIFQVASACGLGALAAAKANHDWGIGVDIDQSSLGPHILTSVLKRLDVAVFDTVKSLQAGRFHPGTDAIFDLANGGVGLGKISKAVPEAFTRRLDSIRREIADGKIIVNSRLP